MNENMDLKKYDLSGPGPEDETQRQYYYMAKAKGYVDKLAADLGRKPTCCVTTFGCQMNARDSEKLGGILELVGYEMVEHEQADFVISTPVLSVIMITSGCTDVWAL